MTRIQGPQGPQWTPEVQLEEQEPAQASGVRFEDALRAVQRPGAPVEPALDRAVQSVAQDIAAGRLDDPDRLLPALFERVVEDRFAALPGGVRAELQRDLLRALGDDPDFMLALERELERALLALGAG